MIAYRDFVPESIKGTWLKAATYESFDAAVTAANSWLTTENVKVLQIETVVLPNIHAPSEAGTADADLGTVSGWASWNQFLRIWYSSP